MIFVRLAIGSTLQRPPAPEHRAAAHVEEQPARAAACAASPGRCRLPVSGTSGTGSAGTSGSGSALRATRAPPAARPRRSARASAAPRPVVAVEVQVEVEPPAPTAERGRRDRQQRHEAAAPPAPAAAGREHSARGAAAARRYSSGGAEVSAPITPMPSSARMISDSTTSTSTPCSIATSDREDRQQPDERQAGRRGRGCAPSVHGYTADGRHSHPWPGRQTA